MTVLWSILDGWWARSCVAPAHSPTVRPNAAIQKTVLRPRRACFQNAGLRVPSRPAAAVFENGIRRVSHASRSFAKGAGSEPFALQISRGPPFLFVAPLHGNTPRWTSNSSVRPQRATEPWGALPPAYAGPHPGPSGAAGKRGESPILRGAFAGRPQPPNLRISFASNGTSMAGREACLSLGTFKGMARMFRLYVNSMRGLRFTTSSRA